MKKINIAIIGAGRMGQLHAKNFEYFVYGANIKAVCDQEKALAQKLAIEVEGEVYSDVSVLLLDESIDAVVITTPVQTHKTFVLQALEAGKHVFCEKPLCLNIEDANDMYQKAKETKKVFQVGYMRRFDKGYETAKQKISEGAIGTPVFIRSTSRDPGLPPVPGWGCFPEKSGDISFELCSHDYDSIRWLLDDEVESVFGQAAVLSSIKEKEICGGTMMNDTIALTLKFSRGALGTVEGLLNIKYGYDARTEIIGDEGVISIGQMNYIDVVTGTSEHKISLPTAPSFTDRFAEAYIKEGQHFIDCILNGQTPIVGVRDGLEAVKIAAAVNKSIQLAAPVNVTGEMLYGSNISN
ncbi:Gfo/Idh/MocA family oxidoreductase [Peribacillus sp. YIM B13472]|uniref:Gfo/Idh/MocA family oxidoreductase n=1 Tax=Peribacillus sp. YIM B13472 TaxID=3366297 RepID=UPI003672077B